jgi:hypothetical protein
VGKLEKSRRKIDANVNFIVEAGLEKFKARELDRSNNLLPSRHARTVESAPDAINRNVVSGFAEAFGRRLPTLLSLPLLNVRDDSLPRARRQQKRQPQNRIPSFRASGSPKIAKSAKQKQSQSQQAVIDEIGDDAGVEVSLREIPKTAANQNHRSGC